MLIVLIVDLIFIDESSADVQYVDLLLNPERYTGYKGSSAHRIWNSIYKENCFRYVEIDFKLYNHAIYHVNLNISFSIFDQICIQV